MIFDYPPIIDFQASLYCQPIRSHVRKSMVINKTSFGYNNMQCNRCIIGTLFVIYSPHVTTPAHRYHKKTHIKSYSERGFPDGTLGLLYHHRFFHEFKILYIVHVQIMYLSTCLNNISLTVNILSNALFVILTRHVFSKLDYTSVENRSLLISAIHSVA